MRYDQVQQRKHFIIIISMGESKDVWRRCLSSVSCLLDEQRQNAGRVNWTFDKLGRVVVSLTRAVEITLMPMWWSATLTHTRIYSEEVARQSKKHLHQRSAKFDERSAFYWKSRERKYLHVTTRVTVAFNDDYSWSVGRGGGGERERGKKKKEMERERERES